MCLKLSAGLSLFRNLTGVEVVKIQRQLVTGIAGVPPARSAEREQWVDYHVLQKLIVELCVRCGRGRPRSQRWIEFGPPPRSPSVSFGN